MKKYTLSKSELAHICGVSLKKVRQWCNVDYYDELKKTGYKKNQQIFTPRQTEFLKQNIIEFTENQ